MNWHYLINDEPHGPVSDAELAALAGNGTLRPESYVWTEGMADWQPYHEVAAQNPAIAVPASPTATVPAAGNAPESEPAKPVAAEPVREPEPLANCSRCDAAVPRSQMITVGTMSLCPKCQVGYERQLRGEEAPVVYASPLARLAAFILDSIICNVVAALFFATVAWLATTYFANQQTQAGIILIGVVCVLLWTLNYFVGRIAKEGATPAMKLFKIKVITTAGVSPGTWRALARILVIGLVNSVTGGLGHLAAFFDSRKRSIHDMICGTMVVKR